MSDRLNPETITNTETITNPLKRPVAAVKQFIREAEQLGDSGDIGAMTKWIVDIATLDEAFQGGLGYKKYRGVPVSESNGYDEAYERYTGEDGPLSKRISEYENNSGLFKIGRLALELELNRIDAHG